MNRYTIHCTEEQTTKALELGAPIECQVNKLNGSFYNINPTAEQMIGWLEEQGIYIIVPIPLIKDLNKNDFSKPDAFEYIIVNNGIDPYSGEYLTRKEATLAAIDIALDYLSNNK